MKLKLTVVGMILASAAFVARGALVLEYKFDMGSGNAVTDTSGNGWNSTITGPASWVGGVEGSAVSLDGVTNFVALPGGAFAGMSNQISIVAWVYGGPSHPEESTFIYGVDSGGDRELQVHLPWSNGQAYWRAPGQQIGYGLSPALTSGQWNHWAFTKNADTGLIRIFANATLVANGTSSEELFFVADAWLGNDPGNPDRV